MVESRQFDDGVPREDGARAWDDGLSEQEVMDWLETTGGEVVAHPEWVHGEPGVEGTGLSRIPGWPSVYIAHGEPSPSSARQVEGDVNADN